MVAAHNQVLESSTRVAAATQLEGEVKRLTRELQQKDGEREAALALQREELLGAQAEKLQHLKTLVMQERQAWFRTGACQLKALFLGSPAGQRFLGVLKDELIQGYRQSPCSLADYSHVGAYFLREGIDIAFDDYGLTDEQRAKCDKTTVFRRIDKVKAERYAHITPGARRSDAWWLPAMNEAAELMVNASLVSWKEDEELPYALDLFPAIDDKFITDLASSYEHEPFPLSSQALDAAFAHFEATPSGTPDA